MSRLAALSRAPWLWAWVGALAVWLATAAYTGGTGSGAVLTAALTFGAFEPIDWLGRPDTALGSIMAMSIWQAVGFHMVIWLSGLQTISPTLYEAAEIEGASKWQTFRYVTWPGLRNTAVLVLIVITMQAFAG